MTKRRHFAGGDPSEKGKTGMPDETLPELQFLELIKAQRYQDAIAMMPEVEDINAIDVASGAAAIHMAAGRRATILLKALWGRDDLNELRQDTMGRYPSEVAWDVGGDEELSALLMERENAYAKSHDLKAWPKPGPALLNHD